MKFPKCKNQTIVDCMHYIFTQYGFTDFSISWEISNKSWELWCRSINSSLPTLIVKKDTPTIIQDPLLGRNFHIDTSIQGWENLLKIELDNLISRETQMYNTRELNGFNDALRQMGLGQLI
jgi:hypothetical protein